MRCSYERRDSCRSARLVRGSEDSSGLWDEEMDGQETPGRKFKGESLKLSLIVV